MREAWHTDLLLLTCPKTLLDQETNYFWMGVSLTYPMIKSKYANSGIMPGLCTWNEYYHSHTILVILACSLLFFISRPRSEGWPHHGRTFSIYLCFRSFWLTLPATGNPVHVLMFSIQAVRGLPRLHALGIVLALSFSPGNSLISSCCDHSMIASLLWHCLIVSSLLQLC